MKKICLKCNKIAEQGSNYCIDHVRKTSVFNGKNDKIYRKKKKELYKKSKWRPVREEVLIRDMYTCQICGARAGEVHHIIHLSQDESLAYDIDNLMAVCRDCHFSIHRKEQHKQGRVNRENSKSTMFTRR